MQAKRFCNYINRKFEFNFSLKVMHELSIALGIVKIAEDETLKAKA